MNEVSQNSDLESLLESNIVSLDEEDKQALPKEDEDWGVMNIVFKVDRRIDKINEIIKTANRNRERAQRLLEKIEDREKKDDFKRDYSRGTIDKEDYDRLSRTLTRFREVLGDLVIALSIYQSMSSNVRDYLKEEKDATIRRYDKLMEKALEAMNAIVDLSDKFEDERKGLIEENEKLIETAAEMNKNLNKVFEEKEPSLKDLALEKVVTKKRIEGQKKVALAMLRAGEGAKDISDYLDKARTTVQNWKSDFQDQGVL